MNKYYDISSLLSYNKILNFVIGQRGGGKTFNAKKWCINDFLKRGNEFVWVRRYKTEIKGLKQNFFNDIISVGLFPDVEFSIKGNNLFINNKLAGYLVALSSFQNMKSSSFPKVTKIIYDEFIPETGRYLDKVDETEAFFNLMDTIIRDRDNCRAVLIANNIQCTNRYFDYLDIKANPDKRFTIFESCVIEYYTNEVYANERLQTRFGQLIQGTKYGEFSLNNASLRDNELFIQKRPANCIFCYALVWKGVHLGVWKDNRNDGLYISDKYDESGLIFSMTTDDHQPKMLFLKQFKQMSQIKTLKYAYSIGFLYFENQMVKRYFLDEILPLI
jgi:hypothetical protein